MARRIVFAGGQQIRALARLYRAIVASETDEEIIYIGAEAVGRDAARRAMDNADVLLSETRETSEGKIGSTLTRDMLRPGVTLLQVPYVMADFLWPNAGRPHPLNRGEFVLPGGPYPADFGDSYLDSLMEQGIGEDEAVDRYLALDIVQESGLDAMLDARQAMQQRLDDETGFSVAKYIASAFRTSGLFLSRERLGLPLVQRLAAGVFMRLEAEPSKVGQIRSAPFQGGSMPIHPSIVSHFGLGFLPADRRSPMNNEGRFTFEEYCRRYYRFEWNEPLHQAIARATEDPAGAIPELEKALLRSPGSRRGQRVLEAAQRAAAGKLASVPLAAELEEEPTEAGTAPAIMAPRVAVPVQSHLPVESSPIEFTPFPSLSRRDGPPPGLLAPEARREPTEPDIAFKPEIEPPAPQAYVELPRFGEPDSIPVQAPPARDPRIPLAPAAELIQVLPRLLPKHQGLVGVTDRPFSAMPETMPPPPLRPVLPPELPPEAPRAGFLSRLFRRDG